jgi:hypothetical protein
LHLERVNECNGDVTTVDPTLRENAIASSLPNGLSREDDIERRAMLYQLVDTLAPVQSK